MKKDELFYSYVAGFADGEGCFFISKHGQPRISINQAQEPHKDITIFYDIRDRFVGSSITFCKGYNERATPLIRINLYKRQVIIDFLRHIIPHLRIQKQKAMELLFYTEHLYGKHNRTNTSSGINLKFYAFKVCKKGR